MPSPAADLIVLDTLGKPYANPPVDAAAFSSID
jgi:hypothetical protein